MYLIPIKVINYIFNFKVDFDESGVAQSWNGNPILLDNTYAEDPDTLRLLGDYKAKLARYKETVVGQTAVAINGTNRACRLQVTP